MLVIDSSLSSTYAMVVVGLLTTSVSLTLRLVARYRQQKLSFGVDDYSAIAAWFVFLGANIATIHASLLQASLPPAALPPVPVEKTFFAGVLLIIVALGCGRLSAIFFYRRIFYTIKRDLFDILTKILIVVLVLWTIGFFLSNLLACGKQINESLERSPTVNPASCIVSQNQKGGALSSFLLDFLILILPLPKIWNLQATAARKIAISAVFLIASISLIASALRMTVVFQAAEDPSNTGRGSGFVVIESYFFTLLETAACLTAINLPSIWYFFHHIETKRLRRVFGAVMSFRSTNRTDSAERSHTELVKNQSMEFSDAVPTKRAHHELDPSLSPYESPEESNYRLEAVHYQPTSR